MKGISGWRRRDKGATVASKLFIKGRQKTTRLKNNLTSSLHDGVGKLGASPVSPIIIKVKKLTKTNTETLMSSKVLFHSNYK